MRILKLFVLVSLVISTFSYAADLASDRTDDYFACGFKEWNAFGGKLSRLVDVKGHENVRVPPLERDEILTLSGDDWTNLKGENIDLRADLYPTGIIGMVIDNRTKQSGFKHYSPPFFLKPANEWKDMFAHFYSYAGAGREHGYTFDFACIRATKKVIESFFSEASHW